MAVTVLEALQNAQANLGNLRTLGMGLLPLVQDQLDNAVGLLEKGYSLNDKVEPLLDQYGDIDNVPRKEED